MSDCVCAQLCLSKTSRKYVVVHACLSVSVSVYRHCFFRCSELDSHMSKISKHNELSTLLAPSSPPFKNTPVCRKGTQSRGMKYGGVLIKTDSSY